MLEIAIVEHAIIGVDVVMTMWLYYRGDRGHLTTVPRWRPLQLPVPRVGRAAVVGQRGDAEMFALLK